jgi:hypothetical protein
MRDLFAGLARDAGAAEPDTLARQLVLLYDGAAVSGQFEGGSRAGVVAREAAALLFDAAVVAAKKAKKTPGAATRRKPVQKRAAPSAHR